VNEYSKELMHMTDAEKADYNRQYYRKHRQYWLDYAKTGHGIGRQSSPNTGSDAFPHARKKAKGAQTTGGYKRGDGLGIGPVMPSKNKDPNRVSDIYPHARKKTKGAQTTGGYKRGDGLGIGPVMPSKSGNVSQPMSKEQLRALARSNFRKNAGSQGASHASAASVSNSKSHGVGLNFVKGLFRAVMSRW
jgi:hypothetical protein